jgi:hypothetical protein
MLNHTFGYGLTINGVWVLNTEYSNQVQQLLIAEAKLWLKNIRILRVTVVFYWEMKITMVFGMVQKLKIFEDRESTIRAHALYKLLIKR